MSTPAAAPAPPPEVPIPPPAPEPAPQVPVLPTALQKRNKKNKQKKLLRKEQMKRNGTWIDRKLFLVSLFDVLGEVTGLAELFITMRELVRPLTQMDISDMSLEVAILSE